MWAHVTLPAGSFVLFANTEESAVRSARCEIALSSALPFGEGRGQQNRYPLEHSLSPLDCHPALVFKSSGGSSLSSSQCVSQHHSFPIPLG